MFKRGISLNDALRMQLKKEESAKQYLDIK